jgi:hypothetical protein
MMISYQHLSKAEALDSNNNEKDVSSQNRDAERRGRHSFASRGNEKKQYNPLL